MPIYSLTSGVQLGSTLHVGLQKTVIRAFRAVLDKNYHVDDLVSTGWPGRDRQPMPPELKQKLFLPRQARLHSLIQPLRYIAASVRQEGDSRSIARPTIH